MKRLLYGVAALIFAGIFVSIIGIVADEANLTLWTQSLMWCLLGTVLIVPAVVYAASSSSGAGTQAPESPRSETVGTMSAGPEQGRSDAREPASRPRRSPGRLLAYVLSAGLVVWTAVSLVSLFVDQSRLAFWTESVMWSLLALVVWAPVMAFFINPFEDPSLQATQAEPPDTGEPEDFVPSSSPAPAMRTRQPASDAERRSGLPADEQATLSESGSQEDDDTTRSGEHVV